jgi:hypothetical protein
MAPSPRLPTTRGCGAARACPQRRAHRRGAWTQRDGGEGVDVCASAATNAADTLLLPPPHLPAWRWAKHGRGGPIAPRGGRQAILSGAEQGRGGEQSSVFAASRWHAGLHFPVPRGTASSVWLTMRHTVSRGARPYRRRHASSLVPMGQCRHGRPLVVARVIPNGRRRWRPQGAQEAPSQGPKGLLEQVPTDAIVVRAARHLLFHPRARAPLPAGVEVEVEVRSPALQAELFLLAAAL